MNTMDDIQKEAIKRAESYLEHKARDKTAKELAWLYGIAFTVLIYSGINIILY